MLARLPDGRRINLRCSGAGSPTVLLEGGYEATSEAWYKIAPRIAKTNRVCAYDRAGLGFSDPGPLPRDGAAIAADLDLALRAARLSGPFVVVGHSAGGLYVRLFADRRPRDVVGMVLVESSVEHQDKAFAAAFGPGVGSLKPLQDHAQACLTAARDGALPSLSPALSSCAPPAKSGETLTAGEANARQAALRGAWQTSASEIDNLMTRTSDELDRGRPSYGDMPLVVLTAANAFDSMPAGAPRQAVQEVWAQLHRQIAARSTRGSAQLVAGSSHMMIFDRPDAVVAAIDEVVAAARSRGTDHARPRR
jgi:pimeloyl-ACP methyl ester carboxylesterase